VIRFDVIIVGGGPAGSSCARVLVRAGLRVAVIDRRRFPRVKPCGGWISAPVWDVLELSRREYPGGVWPWRRCHVRYRGRDHSIGARGDFIRRVELDDFLLRRSGAQRIQGTPVSSLERCDGAWAPVALECGYYDQAHLIRDFNQFAQQTPGVLFAEQSPLTESFTRKSRVSDFSNTTM